MQNTTSTTACESRAASSVATVFVCYEENYAELFDEAGAVNHMFVTAMQSRRFRGQRSLCRKQKRIIIFRSMKENYSNSLMMPGRNSMPAFGFTGIKVNSRKRAMGSVSTVLICLNLRIC